jgi:hypothetical protein
MPKIDWSQFDGLMFEELVSDLLRAEGFGVEPSGVGPDGGVDIVAAQQIRYGYNEPVPFTWAVQCKFSANPRKAISPHQVGEIYDILQDERFRAKNLQGFFLTTNVRLSINLVGRLRGMTQRGQYYGTWWDNRMLETLLHKHRGIYNKYFTDWPRRKIIFKRPLSRDYGPGAMTMDILVSGPTADEELTEENSLKTEAFVDTGADVSFVSASVIERVREISGGVPYRMAEVVDGFGAGTRYVRYHSVAIQIPGAPAPVDVEVLEVDVDYFGLGRDALSNLVFYFDGPNQTFIVFD